MKEEHQEKKELARRIMKAIIDKDQKVIEELAEKKLTMLLYGDNMFGEPVFSYVEYTVSNFMKMREAMVTGQNFKPSDYGNILAEGKGDPSDELKEEMRIKYGLVDTPRPEKSDTEEKKETPTSKFSTEKPMAGLNKELSNEAKKLGHDIQKLIPD